ncbi:MAG TPA: hypothetical protein VM686_09520 [Polyangiaceae bacterium]|nr:hypothetical protein [Polyangiaceae bacterium]
MWSGEGRIAASLCLLLCCPCCVSKEEPSARASAFFERKVSVICEKNAECCHAAMTVAETRDYCLDSTEDLKRLGFDLDQRLEAALAVGNVSYDEAARDDCFEAVRATTCSDWQHAVAGQPIEPCGRVFVGKLPDGASCSSYFECASQFCDSPSGGSGTCKPKAGAGDACVDAHDMSCADGLDCTIFGQVKPTCVARGELGAACSDGEQCYSQECDGGSCSAACWSNPLSHQIVGL